MDVFSLLSEYGSWQLHRVSHNTYPQDVVVTLRRQDRPLSEKEVRAVAILMRKGSCYRCRISKGQFYFGSTPEEAVAAAVNAEKKLARLKKKP